MTGDHGLDMGLFIALMVLFAVSEALGKSQRFKANGVVQFISEFMSAGAKGVLAVSPASGLMQKIIEKAEPCIEHCVENALDKSAANSDKSVSPCLSRFPSSGVPLPQSASPAVGTGQPMGATDVSTDEGVTSERLTPGHR